MAKELPYFKFEPNQWENGGIQYFDRNAKGLFIDICSMYWSRLGELDYALALQKLCNGNAYELDLLMQRDIIVVIEGKIVIEFLDEQLNEFQETSKKRADAANKRWSDASALQMQSKSNAIREDKKREDKSIKEHIPPFEDFQSYALSKEPRISKRDLKFKYDAWVENGWKNGNDRKIKNWKTTLLNTIPHMQTEKRKFV
jgi:hypothetical protein